MAVSIPQNPVAGGDGYLKKFWSVLGDAFLSSQRVT